MWFSTTSSSSPCAEAGGIPSKTFAERTEPRLIRGLAMQLYHRDFGGDGKPALVVLHGMLGSSRNWQTAGRDLAGSFHVLAPDLRNHGASPHAETMSYEEMMGDVLGWMDAQGIGQSVFLGHSMGGKIAMLLACRHPARVERLIIVDIAPRNYYWPGHRASFAAMNELNLGDLRSRAEAELRFEARVPSWAMRKFLATNLERSAEGKWSWQINLPALTHALPELERNPLQEGDRFEGAVRFIAGGRSTYIEPDDHPVIRAHFPAVEFRLIENAGHNPHLETREAFVAAVLKPTPA